MSLSSYADIQALVTKWLNRSDYVAYVPDFIALAEARLNRILDDNVNLTARATAQAVGGHVNLPDDFNGVVSLVYPVSGGGALSYLAPDVLFGKQPSTGGYPGNYTISAGCLHVYPVADVTLDLRYRIKLDALKYGTNWLLENHPDAYVFGALVEAADFIEEEERGPGWQAKFDRIMSEINRQAQDIAYGGPLQITPSYSI